MDVLELLEIESAVSLHLIFRNVGGRNGRTSKGNKVSLGKRLFIPGHHYQKDVIQVCDARGDSLKLTQICTEMHEAELLLLWGSFYGRTADMLTKPHQKVILPDISAGCSMVHG